MSTLFGPLTSGDTDFCAAVSLVKSSGRTACALRSSGCGPAGGAMIGVAADATSAGDSRAEPRFGCFGTVVCGDGAAAIVAGLDSTGSGGAGVSGTPTNVGVLVLSRFRLTTNFIIQNPNTRTPI